MSFNLLNVVCYLNKTELVRVLDIVYSDKNGKKSSYLFQNWSDLKLILKFLKTYVFPLISITAFEKDAMSGPTKEQKKSGEGKLDVFPLN